MADSYHPAADQGFQYPPCIRAANELDPIVISQMEPQTHHRGKRIAVRVVQPPVRTGAGAPMTVVQDEEGTEILLGLLYQPGEAVLPAEQILRVDGCYLIKEPFLTHGPKGVDNLQVDHPSDIMLMPQDHELLPVKLKRSDPIVGGSGAMRIKGNDAVGKKRWAEAEHLYTIAIQIASTAEEEQLAYLNRSLANLHLKRPATALEDAIKSYGADSSARTEKGLFREASALYELAKYDQCLDRLQNLEKVYPGNSSAMAMLERVQARLREQQSGQYDFRRMYEQAEATPPLIDCASYTGPVEIRDAPGKGRGVFTTRKVLAGELLICEKAFGYAYYGKYVPEIRGITDRNVRATLQVELMQKLSHNIEAARSFGTLHRGGYDAVSVCEVDGRPVVDAFLVDRVIGFTSFATARSSLSALGGFVAQSDMSHGDLYSAIGIWSFASRLNHSCIYNARSSFIGDMRIVRATQDLEEGSELLVCYTFPTEFDSYDAAQKSLAIWGFVCDCALCLDRKVETNKAFTQRMSLFPNLMHFMGIGGQAVSISNAQKMLEKINQTYSDAARRPGGIRLEVWSMFFELGVKLIAMDRPSDAIEMTLKCLEALGFVISASPPRGLPESRKPELLIRQWGLANTFVINAFLNLHQAYKKVAPPLSAVALKYMEAAYSMVMGEKDTILDTFPEIA